MGKCLDKVPVLYNQRVSDCPNNDCTVGIPITSISLLNEFTYCGKYNFKFLRESILMYMDAPHTYIRILDFEDKVGILKHDNCGYFFFFPNQTMKPDSWQNVCLSIATDSMKLVLNGEVIVNASPNSSMKRQFTETNLWLGGENKPKLMYRRFEGLISGAYLWPESFSLDTLILITTQNKSTESVTAKPLFSWEKFKLGDDLLFVEYKSLDENDPLFKETFQEKEILLIEHKATFEASYHLCQAFGGELSVPLNDQDLDKIGTKINKSEICVSAHIGLMKTIDDKVVTLNGHKVTLSRWGQNEPNGKQYEKCINTYGDSHYNDIKCSEESCFSCEMSAKHVFSLRGIIPIGMDRHYFVSMARKETEIRGFKETECIWNQTWYFGSNLVQDESSGFNTMPPVGVDNWNNGHKLKFSECNNNEFTCHLYGNCVSLNKRCDGNDDCPLDDGSDENNCTLLTLMDGYNKKYPARGITTVSISLDIYDILDIKELEMAYKIYLKVEMIWYDSRILFRNLKLKQENNQLSATEIKKIWTPELLFLNSEQGSIEAGQRNNIAKSEFSGRGYVDIIRKGKSQKNALEELDEDYVYPGAENPIRMENWMFVILDCKFHLEMYPFDNQVCPIKLVKPVNHDAEFVMQWSKSPHLHTTNLLQYEVSNNLKYNNTNATQNEIIVYIKLHRKLSFHIFNTYVPSFCLMMIALFTLFIDKSHFEVTIMVALTSMLVVYTLHQSISANLPQTSYMKMIDIWLVSGLIVPFLIIAILVIMDYMIQRESKEVTEIRNEEKGRLNSENFLKSMQIILPLTVGMFCVIYWLIGLSYYFN